MDKRNIDYNVAVLVIHGYKGKILIERKTENYPYKVFAGYGLIIGGTRIGDDAKNDKGPFDTAIRKIREEFSFERPIIGLDRLNELFNESRQGAYQIPKSNWSPSETDRSALEHIKWAVRKFSRPLGDFEIFVPGEIIKDKNPEWARGDVKYLLSAWSVGLPFPDWEILTDLQNKSGNLSKESLTIITDLSQIMETGLQFAWGHDHVLRYFFLRMGLREALDFPLFPGISAEYCGSPLGTYDDYERFYNIAKKP